MALFKLLRPGLPQVMLTSRPMVVVPLARLLSTAKRHQDYSAITSQSKKWAYDPKLHTTGERIKQLHTTITSVEDLDALDLRGKSAVQKFYAHTNGLQDAI